ncbi:MAG: hypothetical protein SCJ93_02030 [Bacillota bacterium]|nr:hypothetical protein [Bacillota bacterium]
MTQSNENQQSFKRYKVVTSILITIMLVGILIHSGMLFTLNRLLPTRELSYATAEYASVVNMRLSLRQFAERFVAISSIVSIVGGIVILYNFIKSKHVISFHKIFIFFFVTIVVMFACVVPFALYDKAFWGDYFFPIWSILIIMILFFLIMIISNFIKYHREKD